MWAVHDLVKTRIAKDGILTGAEAQELMNIKQNDVDNGVENEPVQARQRAP